jgi:pilus assembly protein CpaB
MKTRIIGALIAIVLAAVGSAILIIYVQSADQRASNGAQLVQVYIVKTEIPVGTPAEELDEYLTVSRIPASAAVPDRVTRLNDLTGLVAAVSLQPGEQLLSARWVSDKELSLRGGVDLPEGMQAVTVALPLEQAVGGAVQPGDTVGILISAETLVEGSTEKTVLTQQVFHKVLVLAVQRGTTLIAPEEGSETKDPVDAVMVTLALTTPNIQTVIWGHSWGTLWLTLEPKSADEASGGPVTGLVAAR